MGGLSELGVTGSGDSGSKNLSSLLAGVSSAEAIFGGELSDLLSGRNSPGSNEIESDGPRVDRSVAQPKLAAKRTIKILDRCFISA